MRSWTTWRGLFLMSYVDLVKEILEDYKMKLGINDDVRVEIKKYKTKTAFINLKTKTIFINETLLDLGKEVLKYLILHELIHLKLGSKYHDSEFNRILYTHIPPEKVSELRGLIASRLLPSLRNNVMGYPIAKGCSNCQRE